MSIRDTKYNLLTNKFIDEYGQEFCYELFGSIIANDYSNRVEKIECSETDLGSHNGIGIIDNLVVIYVRSVVGVGDDIIKYGDDIDLPSHYKVRQRQLSIDRIISSGCL